MKQVLIFLLFLLSVPVLSDAQLKNPFQPLFFTDSLSKYPAAFEKRVTGDTFQIKESNPSLFPGVVKNREDKDDLFYLLAAVTMLLAVLRFFFNRYFATLFRVFFNTSLRQSQLTDQLLQAKLPSLLLNFFFFISGGLYIYFLADHYKILPDQNKWLLRSACVLLLTLIYCCKFLFLKFSGWLSAKTEITNNYIFVIFLINKIIGILLLPFLLLLAFASPALIKPAIVLSYFIAGFLLLLRFFKSYGLVQNKLSINRLHFFLLVVAIEILPFLLIYKVLMLLLNKNL